MRAVLGTLNFVRSEVDMQPMLDAFASPRRIDTAAYYGNEAALGELLDSTWYITTKADPWPAHDFGRAHEGGGLLPAALDAQITQSLLALPHIDQFLMHGWDAQWDAPFDTSAGAAQDEALGETLEACDTLFRREAFDTFGVSNFTQEQVVRTVQACERACLTLRPASYQGMYNVACRGVEDIFPELRDHNIRFEAYNPLAGGLLTGRYAGTRAASERWADYTSMFFTKPNMRALGAILTPKASLHWLAHHSMLDVARGDSVVLGASTPSQLQANADALACAESSISPEDLQRINDLAMACAHETPACFV